MDRCKITFLRHLVVRNPDAQAKTRAQADAADELERDFSLVQPIMDFLSQQQGVMGDRYPEAFFIPPVLVDAETRDKMLSGMRVGYR